MFKIHSITGRIFIGVIVAVVLGIIVMLISPIFNIPIFSMLGLGTLMLFIFMGLTLGLVGTYDNHPIFGFKMKWWIRGPFIGFTYMLMYILLSYNSLEVVINSNAMSWMGFESPFWALIDGVTIGSFMAWMEFHIAGEGSKLPLK